MSQRMFPRAVHIGEGHTKGMRRPRQAWKVLGSQDDPEAHRHCERKGEREGGAVSDQHRRGGKRPDTVSAHGSSNSETTGTLLNLRTEPDVPVNVRNRPDNEQADFLKEQR